MRLPIISTTSALGLLLLAVVLPYHSFGADPTALYYRFIVGINLQECKANGDTVGGSFETPPDGSKFTLVGTKEDNYIIRFWQWKRSRFIGGGNQKDRETLYSTFNVDTIPNPTRD